MLRLIEDPSANEVTQEFMSRGIALAEHYSSEALRLFQGAKIDRDLRLAAQLLDWLASWGDPNVSLPDIYQYGPNAIRDRKTALRLVSILVTHKYLVKLQGTTRVNGERRRDVWRIVSGELDVDNESEQEASAQVAQVAQVAKDDTDEPALPKTLAGLATLAAEQIAELQQGSEGQT